MQNSCKGITKIRGDRFRGVDSCFLLRLSTLGNREVEFAESRIGVAEVFSPAIGTD
jgi:hypothetical protein